MAVARAGPSALAILLAECPGFGRQWVGFRWSAANPGALLAARIVSG